MEINTLTYLLAIRKTGSISLAAEQVHVSQSAMSQCLSKAEQEIGCPIFIRSNRRLLPTQVGEIFLNGAEEMVSVNEQMLRELRNFSAGSKRIRVSIASYFYSFFNSPAVEALKNRFPYYEIDFFPASTDQSWQYLRNDLVDCAILTISEQRNSLFDLTPLAEEELLLAVPKTLLTKEIEENGLPGCSGIPFVLPKQSTVLRPMMDKALLDAHITPASLLQVDDILNSLGLAQLGYGATFVPRRTAASINALKLFSLPVPVSFTLAFAVPKHAEDREELRLLRDIAVQVAK